MEHVSTEQTLPLANTVACSDETVAATAETASVSHCFMSTPEMDSTNTGYVTWDLDAAEKH